MAATLVTCCCENALQSPSNLPSPPPSLLPPFLLPPFLLPPSPQQLKEYIQTDLLPMIYSAGDQDQMMEESQDAAKRREEMIRMYHTCKEALNLISTVSSKTGTHSDPFPSHDSSSL